MNISKNSVVSLDYTLKDEAGEILDTTNGIEPLEYIHGRGNLIAGLERVLDGKEEGALFKNLEVKPEDAYGEYFPNLVAEVSRDSFPENVTIKVGMQFEAESENGSQIVTVTKIEGDNITVDGNHPLAGKTLYFDVRVVAVREATEEEKAFGLSHSCGCGCSGGDCESGADDEGCFCGHGNGCCGCGCS